MKVVAYRETLHGEYKAKIFMADEDRAFDFEKEKFCAEGGDAITLVPYDDYEKLNKEIQLLKKELEKIGRNALSLSK